ncbi:MAG: hypothetical protein ABIH00_04450 [Armatimonadota bacterium]
MSLEITPRTAPQDNNGEPVGGIKIVPRNNVGGIKIVPRKKTDNNHNKNNEGGAEKTAPAKKPLVNPNYPIPDNRITGPLSLDSYPRLVEIDENLGDFLNQFFLSKYSIYPDNEGKIKHIFMEYSKYETGCSHSSGELDAHKAILLNTDENVKISFLVKNNEDEEVLQKLIKEAGIKNPDRIEIIITGKTPRGWARDPAVAVEDDGGENHILLFERHSPLRIEAYRKNNPGSAELEAELSEVAQDRAMFTFINDNNINVADMKEVIGIVLDGGNIIRIDKDIFIGTSVIYNTCETLWHKYHKNPAFNRFVAQYYKELTGKEVPDGYQTIEILTVLTPNIIATFFNSNVIVIGEDNPETDKIESQPTFHIDMLMGPAKNSNGENVVMVGDPKMAKEIFDNLSDDEKEKNGSLKMLLEDYINKTNINAEQNNFDAVADYLKKQGFKVMRTPYLEHLPGLPTVAFTNNLIEDYTDEKGKHIKRIFLPQYNIEPLDKKAADIFRSMEYEIIFVDCSSIGKCQGSIRCKTQVIKE